MTPVAMEHRRPPRTRPDLVRLPHRKVDGGARAVELRLGAIDTRPARARACPSRSPLRVAPADAAASADIVDPLDRTWLPRGALIEVQACASPVGAAPVELARTHPGLRAMRGRLWHQRRRPRPPHTAPESGGAALWPRPRIAQLSSPPPDRVASPTAAVSQLDLTSVPHFQDHASDNWEPEGAGSDGVVNRSWSGRRSNMLSWSTCSIW